MTPNQPRPPQIPHTAMADPAVTEWMVNFSSYVYRELAKRLPTGTPTSSVMLVSPNGSVYTVEVDDAGVVSTTLVSSP